MRQSHILLVLSLLVFIGALFGGTVQFEVARALAFVALLTSYSIGHKQQPFAPLLSPAFLLGGMVIMLYSVVPATAVGVYVFFQTGDVEQLWPSIVLQHSRQLPFFASDAERVILIFGLILLLVDVVVRILRQNVQESKGSRFLLTQNMEAIVIALSVLLSALMLAQVYLPSIPDLRFILYPLQSFIILYVLHHALRDGRSLLLPLFGAVILVVVMFLIDMKKMPVFFCVALFIVWTTQSKPKIAKLIFSIATVSVLCFGLVATLNYHNNKYPRPDGSSTFITTAGQTGFVLLGKITSRQADTGNCLRNVLNHAAAEPTTNPSLFFWIEGLVPRAIWPDKPNLSLGNEYYHSFCGGPSSEKNPVHSSSITLLGQPFLRGGVPAFIFNVALVVALLGYASFATRSESAKARILVMSMLPWWIDFDQDFTLYIAHIVKFGMVAACALLVFAAAERFTANRQTSGP